MSLTPVSAGSNSISVQNSAPDTEALIRQQFRKLSQALQSSDLNGAQQAFTQLQQALNSGEPPPGTATGGLRVSPAASALRTDFNNLGQALASGDLQGAQKAFASVSGDLFAAAGPGGAAGAGKTHGGHHHHHDAAAPLVAVTTTAASGVTGETSGSLTGTINLLG